MNTAGEDSGGEEGSAKDSDTQIQWQTERDIHTGR